MLVCQSIKYVNVFSEGLHLLVNSTITALYGFYSADEIIMANKIKLINDRFYIIIAEYFVYFRQVCFQITPCSVVAQLGIYIASEMFV